MVVGRFGGLGQPVDEGDRLAEVLEPEAALKGAAHLVPALGIDDLARHHSKGCRFSAPGSGIPITRPAIEGGSSADGDRHALLVDSESCTLYELYHLYPSWSAGSGAIWDLTSNALRPRGWTSADAAGLPILPGLARYDDVAAGSIDHALRFTVGRSRRAYLYPARHFASSPTSKSLPPMGLRLRLRRDYFIGSFPPQAQIILRALKRYGMIVADNGSSWYVSGAPDPGWDNDDLHTLGKVKGSNFRVVDTTSLRP
jgi:hypothetical protein